MSETSFTLKYPQGEFTHSELAKHNGKTNQQVWTRLQAALKSGDLIHTRLRSASGRGKPSKLYAEKGFVVPNTPAAPAQPATPPAPSTPAPAAVVPSEPVETVPTPINAAPAPEVTPAVEASVEEDEGVILPTEEEIEAATAPVVEPTAEVTPALPAAEPAEAPAVVEVARVEPQVEIVSPAVAPVRNLTTPQATEMSETCPVCNSKLFSQPDATGVMVWCAQPLEVCKSTENPFGHGKNAKEAYATLVDKWAKLATPTVK